MTIEDGFDERDKVGARGHSAGTHHSDFEGLAPTGKPVKFAYIDLYRVEVGKLAENWLQIDYRGLMQQLGLVPKPGQQPAARRVTRH